MQRSSASKELDLTEGTGTVDDAPRSSGSRRSTFNAETGETEKVEDESEKAGKFAPVAFVYLLWIAIMTATQMLLTNTVEEKSNRLIEVLLSSVSPIQLMAGKVIGIGATGLTMVVAWVRERNLIGIRFLPVGRARRHRL